MEPFSLFLDQIVAIKLGQVYTRGPIKLILCLEALS